MSSWLEKNNETKVKSMVSEAREQELNAARDEALPVVKRDTDRRNIAVIEFQPVRSPGIYEAEFAVKGEDIIFHFWPYGFHKADREGHRPPAFRSGFEKKLRETMESVFGQNRFEMREDRDVGAWFIKAIGFANNQFHRKLCIRACEVLHLAMGGKADS